MPPSKRRLSSNNSRWSSIDRPFLSCFKFNETKEFFFLKEDDKKMLLSCCNHKVLSNHTRPGWLFAYSGRTHMTPVLHISAPALSLSLCLWCSSDSFPREFLYQHLLINLPRNNIIWWPRVKDGERNTREDAEQGISHGRAVVFSLFFTSVGQATFDIRPSRRSSIFDHLSLYSHSSSPSFFPPQESFLFSPSFVSSPDFHIQSGGNFRQLVGKQSNSTLTFSSSSRAVELHNAGQPLQGGENYSRWEENKGFGGKPVQHLTAPRGA